MANYIARVELHGAHEEEDYEALHANMEERGYLRTIQGDDGTTYQLPTGTYVVQNTDATLEVAHDAAEQAATLTGFQHSVVVARWDMAQYSGLEIT